MKSASSTRGSPRPRTRRRPHPDSTSLPSHLQDHPASSPCRRHHSRIRPNRRWDLHPRHRWDPHPSPSVGSPTLPSPGSPATAILCTCRASAVSAATPTTAAPATANSPATATARTTRFSMSPSPIAPTIAGNATTSRAAPQRQNAATRHNEAAATRSYPECSSGRKSNSTSRKQQRQRKIVSLSITPPSRRDPWPSSARTRSPGYRRPPAGTRHPSHR
jgi:hypothetical protein